MCDMVWCHKVMEVNAGLLTRCFISGALRERGACAVAGFINLPGSFKRARKYINGGGSIKRLAYFKLVVQANKSEINQKSCSWFSPLIFPAIFTRYKGQNWHSVTLKGEFNSSNGPCLHLLYHSVSLNKVKTDIFCSVSHPLTAPPSVPSPPPPPPPRLASGLGDWLTFHVRQSLCGRDSNNPLVFPALWIVRHSRARPGQTVVRQRQHPHCLPEDACSQCPSFTAAVRRSPV